MIVSADVPAVVARMSEFYGHAAILRAYVGAEDDRLRIAGQLQHGWSVGAGVDPAPTPLYLWNDRSAAVAANALNADITRAGSAGEREVIRIGAPYLYLPSGPTVMETGRVAPGLLAFPQHSTSGHPLLDGYASWERYAGWLEDLRREADLEQVTVCLHENEYDDPSVKHILLRAGLVMATCGSARMRRTTYLDRLRALVRQHGFATSNAIGTAILYAAFEGAPVFVGGPAFTRAPVPATTEVCYPQTSDPAWIDREFPGWRCGWRDARPHQEDAARELGAAHRKSRAELWDLLLLAVTP